MKPAFKCKQQRQNPVWLYWEKIVTTPIAYMYCIPVSVLPCLGNKYFYKNKNNKTSQQTIVNDISDNVSGFLWLLTILFA